MTPDLSGPVEIVARRLLGHRLVTEFEDRTVVVIDEVEAYGGVDDPASHAYRGPTTRNASMFGAAGTLYVYRSYGIHWCANVATGLAGKGQAVLIRGGRVVEGKQTVVRRRGRTDHLADGPGKLTQALGITGDHDGTSVFRGPVRLAPGPAPDPAAIRTTPRIGITREVDRPWRFVVVSGQ
ncbi:MAG: DNA-3-methyladenine glycosylase [bacterium]|nr:DNA-3-methyladenine glycosylase [bacterium]MDE0288312.1 DNA-3-methyladenine glycosylase [bacterium]MDE0438745.1 DNA-3-methyladenine glycosylase [bacterium]